MVNTRGLAKDWMGLRHYDLIDRTYEYREKTRARWMPDERKAYLISIIDRDYVVWLTSIVFMPTILNRQTTNTLSVFVQQTNNKKNCDMQIHSTHIDMLYIFIFFFSTCSPPLPYCWHFIAVQRVGDMI